MRQFSSMASRVLFVGACALAALAICEKVANMRGQTLLLVGGYAPSHLLEFAAIALLFVITLQLRELGEGSRGPGG